MNRPVDFGKYRLLERLNVGGMAEVFKAKMYGVEGFERIVAVKRILPSIAEDTEFITMFIDEAKIAVQLTHANIAQIFDLGKVGESFYIAMEYVEGKDLRAMFDRQRSQGDPMPYDIACYIGMKMCEGLDYAHNKRASDGRHLALVHRDVSPQNILVSYDGEVKVIDFGIAKAAGKAGKTRSGILKGKFSYMSPEQSRGLPLDRRSDLFTAAICIYELVTGERLFLGETDISTVEKVRNVEIVPPRQHNPSIPRRLEHILLKALARRPEDRYQDAMALYDALRAFLAEQGETPGQRELRDYMQKVFAREIAKLSDGLSQNWGLEFDDSFGVSTIAEGGDSSFDNLPTEAHSGHASPPPPPPPPRRRRPAASRRADASPRRPKAIPLDAPRASRAARDHGGRARLRSVDAGAPQPERGPTHDGSAAFNLDPTWDDEDFPTEEFHGASQSEDRRPSRQAQRRDAQEEGFEFLYDEGRSGRRRVDAAPHTPATPVSSTTDSRLQGTPSPFEIESVPGRPVSGPTAVTEYLNKTRRPFGLFILILLSLGLLVLMAMAIQSVISSREPGIVQLKTEPSTVVVKVDGKVISAKESPFVLSDMAPGVTHQLEVSAEGFRSWRTEVTLAAGQVLELPDVTLAATQQVPLLAVKEYLEEKGETGFILDTRPQGLGVSLNGKRLDGKTPMRVTGIEARQHTLKVHGGSAFGEPSYRVDVRSKSVARVGTLALPPKRVSLALKTQPSGARATLIFEGGEQVVLPGRTPLKLADLRVAPGVRLRLETDGAKAVELPLPLKAGEDAVLLELKLQKRADAAPAVATPTPEVKRPERRQSRRNARRRAPMADRAPVATGTGTLRVNSRPWAEVELDGKSVGNTPLMSLKVEAGEHTLRLRNPDFGLERELRVSVKPGQTVTKVVNLGS